MNKALKASWVNRFKNDISSPNCDEEKVNISEIIIWNKL